MAKTRKSNNEDVSYWLSYSDMMAALLLVFALIISITIIQSKNEYETKMQEIKDKQEEIDKQKKEIGDQEETINKLLGVKSEIIESLIDEFKNSGLQINIDEQTGDITFNSDLLFEPDLAVLKDDSVVFLNAFLPKYFGILLNEKYVNNLAEIKIEGHTAQFGSYLSCLTLSQERALAVSKYIVDDNSILSNDIDLEKLRTILTVNGRAYYDPVYLPDGSKDDINSRRVEIKFRLKDDEIIEELRDKMKDLLK